MANIELVIKIPEELYEECKRMGDVRDILYESIRNGIVLPEGHGRLKDFDKIISDGISKGFCDWYDEMQYAPTIIEADKAESKDKENKRGELKQ